MAKTVLIVWHRDEEQGYSFASVYQGGMMYRTYLRGELPPRYPVPVVVNNETHAEAAK